ncbi:hypothetical protein [Paenibacillus jiagnxiensis]|uniref:hypothetical protein n=1 Tax=Paenibacillus jiagnxiensis TaxID=3228926 RepID=UPI00339EA428
MTKAVGINRAAISPKYPTARNRAPPTQKMEDTRMKSLHLEWLIKPNTNQIVINSTDAEACNALGICPFK